jgi:hypothetical protein
VEVTYFNLGEHCSELHFPTRRDWLIALHLVKEPATRKSIKKELFSPIGRKGRWTRRMLDTHLSA